MTSMREPFRVRTLGLDLPAVAGAFSRRLHEAGVPVTAERAAWFAQALTVVKPISRRRLYWTARAAFVSDRSHARAFDTVFEGVFGSARRRPRSRRCRRTRKPSRPQLRSRGAAPTAPTRVHRQATSPTRASTPNPAEPTRDTPVPITGQR